MEMLVWLIPISLGPAVWAFFWSLRGHQYDNRERARQRVLLKDFDDAPKPLP
jgi:cbb3-type cytochrome oxidase maturation protein